MDQRRCSPPVSLFRCWPGPWVRCRSVVARRDLHWQPSGDPKLDSRVLVADLSAFPSVTDVVGLFTVNPHRRLTRARFPDADAEVDRGGNYWLSARLVTEW